MSTTIVSVEMDDPLASVKEIFENTRFHHLLVIESGTLVGVISDRDYYEAVGPNLGTIAETRSDAACLNKKVHQIMSRKPVTLYRENTIHDAIDIFNNNIISCIPVLDKTSKPVGVVSWRDIFKVIKHSRT